MVIIIYCAITCAAVETVKLGGPPGGAQLLCVVLSVWMKIFLRLSSKFANNRAMRSKNVISRLWHLATVTKLTPSGVCASHSGWTRLG